MDMDISNLPSSEREKIYEALHVAENAHRGKHIYNPHHRPVSQLPVIYGFNNGGEYGWMRGVIVAEDGKELGGHICSSEAYMPHDLGMLEGARKDLCEKFREHYPDGFRTEFVTYIEAWGHAGLREALHKHDLQIAGACGVKDKEEMPCPPCFA